MGGKLPRLISSGNGKDLAAYLTPKRRTRDFSEAHFERTFAERFLSPDHAVSVISAEQMAGAPGEGLEQFRRRLVPDHDVRIVACVRDLYAHARSCWMQQIKRNAYVHGFRRFVAEAYDDSQCGSVMRYRRVFGEANVALIHLDSLQGDLFASFLGAIGVPAGFAPLPRINRGLSAAEIEALQLCNRLHRSGRLATRISDHLLKVRPTSARAAAWSPEIAAELQARFQGQIDRVNARFFAKQPVLKVGGEPPDTPPDVVTDRLATWRPVLAYLVRDGWRPAGRGF